MNEAELAAALALAYANAPDGEVVAQIILFGIRHVGDLENANIGAVVALADIPGSYATEVRKGMRLAPIVEPIALRNVNELALELAMAANHANDDGRTAAILLFGIKHARDLTAVRLEEVVELSGLSPAYAVEVRKATKLARYVQPLQP